jgi:predicted nucleotidyltransferase
LKISNTPMKNDFNLTEQDRKHLESALRNFPEIEKAMIFGSRAMGNSKKASDVDLAIVGKNITSTTALRLRFLLNEELPLPYFFDVVRYETITNDNLKRHIDEHGVVFFAAPVQ